MDRRDRAIGAMLAALAPAVVLWRFWRAVREEKETCCDGGDASRACRRGRDEPRADGPQNDAHATHSFAASILGVFVSFDFVRDFVWSVHGEVVSPRARARERATSFT